MRIDLWRDGHRSFPMKLGLRVAKWYVGVLPAPPVALSYRPALIEPDFNRYFMRAIRGSGGWNKGHAELFATFVSTLNRCHF